VFDSPNVITTNTLKYLHTIMGATCIGLLVSPTSIIDDWLIGVVALAILDERNSLDHANVDILLN
jgi:hypothetical protein